MKKVFPGQYVLTNSSLSQYLGKVFSFKGFNFWTNDTDGQRVFVSEELLFFGEVFNPHQPEQSNEELFCSIIGKTFEQVTAEISKWTGYFVLIVLRNGELQILGDAAGQLEIFICKSGPEISVASDLLLFNLDLEGTSKFNFLNWTSQKEVQKLLPNHYYKDGEQLRFYPFKEIDLDNSFKESQSGALEILASTFHAYQKRKPLCMAITAGWDSRILLAACRPLWSEMKFFVMKHPSEMGSVDCAIATEISKRLGLDFKVIDYEDLTLLYPKDTFLWNQQNRAYALSQLVNREFPNRYNINGNVSEVARGFYQPLFGKLNPKDLIVLSGLNFERHMAKEGEKWLKNLNIPRHHFGTVLDFFYWEHKMSNWAGNAKSTARLIHQVFSPFNNRELLDVLLHENPRFRSKFHNPLYKNIIDTELPEIVDIPINPTKKKRKIATVNRLGLYGIYRSLAFQLGLLSFEP